MDGRGSEGRGLRWRDSLDIGNTDVDDQLQAVRSQASFRCLDGGYSHIFERNTCLIFHYLNISQWILFREVLAGHSFLDSTRVAVIGTNYGGFLAALMLADR